MLRLCHILKASSVAISANNEGYPVQPPYSPAKTYAEHPFGSDMLAGESNQAYDGVREALRLSLIHISEPTRPY